MKESYNETYPTSFHPEPETFTVKDIIFTRAGLLNISYQDGEEVLIASFNITGGLHEGRRFVFRIGLSVIPDEWLHLWPPKLSIADLIKKIVEEFYFIFEIPHIRIMAVTSMSIQIYIISEKRTESIFSVKKDPWRVDNMLLGLKLNDPKLKNRMKLSILTGETRKI